MNAPVSASLFSAIEMAPRDPILGVTEAYNADQNPAKTNLGVGVYYDDNGKVPLLECVKKAEAELAAKLAPRTYLPIDGLATYDRAVQELVFGAGSAVVTEKRAITVQALGGTGALKLGADFLKHFSPAGTEVWISDPSWENHRALFEMAGFKVNAYPYYDPATRGVNFAGMLDALKTMKSGSVVLLHACCHNPTGADLTDDQWTQVIEVVTSRGLVPFLDMAYQGFGDGIAEDGQVVRRFAEAGGPLFVSNSFSKSFSLYGERVGARLHFDALEQFGQHTRADQGGHALEAMGFTFDLGCIVGQDGRFQPCEVGRCALGEGAKHMAAGSGIAAHGL